MRDQFDSLLENLMGRATNAAEYPSRATRLEKLYSAKHELRERASYQSDRQLLKAIGALAIGFSGISAAATAATYLLTALSLFVTIGAGLAAVIAVKKRRDIDESATLVSECLDKKIMMLHGKETCEPSMMLASALRERGLLQRKFQRHKRKRRNASAQACHPTRPHVL